MSFADTESYMYLTREVDESAQSPMIPNVPQFNDKDELEIARYLDSKLHRSRVSLDIGVQTDSSKESQKASSKQQVFSSPVPEKAWNPIMQSTPAHMSSRGVQPKDILKAKLSKLAQSVEQAHDSESSSEDEEHDEDQERGVLGSKDSSYHDDTPSKPQAKRNTSLKEDKGIGLSPNRSAELEQLAKLKEFLNSSTNGSKVLKSIVNGEPVKHWRIVDDSELESNAKKVKDLEEEIKSLRKQNDDLKEETTIIKSTNISLKEMVELKDRSIAESRDNVRELENSIAEINASMESEISKYVGDTSEKISPLKFPELSTTDSNGISLYDGLNLCEVDNLTMVESQNLLKNILINLNIPFSRVKELVPQLMLRLTHEEILVDFTKRLHTVLYDQRMDITRYLNETGNTGLVRCTSEMLKNVELVYAVLEKK